MSRREGGDSPVRFHRHPRNLRGRVRPHLAKPPVVRERGHLISPPLLDLSLRKFGRRAIHGFMRGTLRHRAVPLQCLRIPAKLLKQLSSQETIIRLGDTVGSGALPSRALQHRERLHFASLGQEQSSPETPGQRCRRVVLASCQLDCGLADGGRISQLERRPANGVLPSYLVHAGGGLPAYGPVCGAAESLKLCPAVAEPGCIGSQERQGRINRAELERGGGITGFGPQE
jgi:hypothetical protein